MVPGLGCYGYVSDDACNAENQTARFIDVNFYLRNVWTGTTLGSQSVYIGTTGMG